jgi:hypothetical protein
VLAGLLLRLIVLQQPDICCKYDCNMLQVDIVLPEEMTLKEAHDVGEPPTATCLDVQWPQ